MSEQIHTIGDDFWNIRGSFRVGKVIDVGTQTSLVRRANGKFVFLDAYTLDGQALQMVNKLTNNGKNLEAVLHLHPFHTVHVKTMHVMFPKAKQYGTARHLERFPKLPWSKLRTEDPELHELFADDFEFSVPRGVDFISDNENVHFSSVLAYHPATRTLHVDDTFMHIRFPLPARLLGIGTAVSLHPTLAKALEKRPGAAEDFDSWMRELVEQWSDIENLCAAHTSALLAADNRGDSIQQRLLKALEKGQSTLEAHSKKYPAE